MKKFIILLVISLVPAFILSQPQAKTFKMPSLTEMIKKNIDDAHQGLKQAQDLFQHISKYKQPASFTDSISLAIEKKDEGGIWFDFGYRGHGLVNRPFTGFETRIDLVKVPDWLEFAFKNALIGLGFGRIINVSPQDEFLIKFVLLSLDKRNKKISSRQFITELFFIFYRLALVKDFPGMDSFLKSITSPFADLIGNIKVNNKTVNEFLNAAWNSFKSIVNYDFKIETKAAFELKKVDLIESNDWKKIVKISLAIGLKTAIQYYAAREKFVQTDNGKQLLDQVKSAQKKKDRLKKRLEFNKVMPGYNKIVSDARNRLKGFLRRIKGIRTFMGKLRDKLSPLLDPFFESIGLPFDLVWPKLEEIEDTTKLYEGEEFLFEEDFGGDDVFGAGDFDFTES